MTLGTADGANVEIRNLVGDGNCYISGIGKDEVLRHQAKHDYDPRKIYEKSPVVKEAVDFISARNIMNGTGGAFNSDMPTSRAMVWTMLARLEGVDTTPAAGEEWWEAGQKWAMENGISDGTNHDGEITREQLAVMLYRFMGEPDHDHEIDHFHDHHETSDWAREGKEWAVGNKIINGKWSNNYRMTECQGAVGNCQLDKLDMLNNLRIEHGRYLNEGLKGIKGITPVYDYVKYCCQSDSIQRSYALNKFEFISLLLFCMSLICF